MIIFQVWFIGPVEWEKNVHTGRALCVNYYLKIVLAKFYGLNHFPQPLKLSLSVTHLLRVLGRV